MHMPDADSTAHSETERKRELFAWADRLLAEIGLQAHIAQADQQGLAGIVLDAEAPAISIAIAAALHPASGSIASHFLGLSGKALKRILTARLSEMKRAREAELKAPAAASSSGSQAQAQPRPNVADLVFYTIAKYVELTEHQAIAVALWIVHTHVFDQFMVSPRLALISPVKGCGKTTLLDLAQLLVARGKRTDSITPAAIYHLVDSEHATLLVDEADNLETASDKLLKAILNAGHRRGATRLHMVRGQLRSFDIFAPMALASIGFLPSTLLHRSVLIAMRRATGPLKRFDALDFDTQQVFHIVRREIEQWANSVNLATDPALPASLRNRPADNWRVLISVADACGEGWSERAREAAVAMTGGCTDEDHGVVLLTDIRCIFDRLRLDRMASEHIVRELLAIEDGMWSEWRGLKDDQQPRKLSQGELARLLAPFAIKPRTVWPLRRTPSSKSKSGYYRRQFEETWAAYCEPDTPTQPNNVTYLGRDRGASGGDTP
jgi:hypothetical protein